MPWTEPEPEMNPMLEADIDHRGSGSVDGVPLAPPSSPTISPWPPPEEPAPPSKLPKLRQMLAATRAVRAVQHRIDMSLIKVSEWMDERQQRAPAPITDMYEQMDEREDTPLYPMRLSDPGA